MLTITRKNGHNISLSTFSKSKAYQGLKNTRKNAWTLTKLPPMDEVSFKQKLNELIAGYTKGKDKGKLCIIVK